MVCINSTFRNLDHYTSVHQSNIDHIQMATNQNIIGISICYIVDHHNLFVLSNTQNNHPTFHSNSLNIVNIPIQDYSCYLNMSNIISKSILDQIQCISYHNYYIHCIQNNHSLQICTQDISKDWFYHISYSTSSLALNNCQYTLCNVHIRYNSCNHF